MDYSYLEALESQELPQGVVAGASNFPGIILAHPKLYEMNGEPIRPDKFNCESWPVRNLDHFYFIPLYVNAVARKMYSEGFTGESSVPSCYSADGIKPIKPLELNGRTINKCSECSLFGYGANYKCHNKGTLVGLAVIEGQLYPFRKDIPGTSMKVFNQFANMLPGALLDAETNGYRKVPYYAKYCKAVVVPKQSARGSVSGWDFITPYKVQDQYFGHPALVTPEHLDVVKQFLSVAISYGQGHNLLSSSDTVQVVHPQPPARLPGITSTTTLTAKPVDVSMSEVTAEEEAVY